MLKVTKVLGIDFGEKNIGIAISVDGYISPLLNLKYQKNHQLEINVLDIIKDLISKENIDIIVAGKPSDRHGDANLAVNMREFYNKLKRIKKAARFAMISEFNTSNDALESQIDFGISKKQSKNTDHSFAAAEIIKRYLASV